MKKRRLKIIVPVLAACIAAILLAFGLTVSYLIDTEEAQNVITIGNVSVRLEEGENYIDNSKVPAGGAPEKAPRLLNTGINDEYVFVRVAVPKSKSGVTLLYDKDVEENGTVVHKEGSKVDLGTATSFELFRTIAKGVTGADGAEPEAVPMNDDPIIDIHYNKGDSTADRTGWVFLRKETDQTMTGDTTVYDYFYFGYNKRLAAVTGDTPKNATVNLFDQMQLKSIIDEEMMTGTGDDAVTVKVDAYAIQADELGIDGLPAGENLLTNEQVARVFEIVLRKQGDGT